MGRNRREGGKTSAKKCKKVDMHHGREREGSERGENGKREEKGEMAEGKGGGIGRGASTSAKNSTKQNCITVAE